MVTKVSYTALLITVSLGLGACRSTNKSASTARAAAPTQLTSETTSYSYEFSKEEQKISGSKAVAEKGCTTERKTFGTLEEMCSVLVNEKENKNCAKKERMELYSKSGCAQVPAIFPVAGVMSCEAHISGAKKPYQIKIDGINNKLAFIGEVPAKLPRVIYEEGKMVDDKPFSNGPLQISCAKTVLVTKTDVSQQAVCKIEVVDKKERNLFDVVRVLYQLDNNAEGVISVSHECDGSGFELAIKNCK